MSRESNTGNELNASLALEMKKLGGSVKNLTTSVDASTDKYKRTDKSFGIAAGGITAIALDKIFTNGIDSFKKAIDPKTDYSKLVNSNIKFHEGNAKVVADSLLAIEYLALKKKDKPAAQAGAIAEATQGGNPVANAASLGGEETNGVTDENSDKRIKTDRAAAGESAEIEKKLWDKKLNYAGAGAGAMANILQNLYVATGSKHRAMFEAMKAFSIAETIIQTYRAAQGAYAAYANIPGIGPVLGAAAAAAAIVSGIARVNAIKNTKPGAATGTINAKGKANPPYKGGSANAYPVPQSHEQALPTQNITVIIHNPLSQQNWAEIAESEIIPAINDAVGNRNIELTVETVN